MVQFPSPAFVLADTNLEGKAEGSIPPGIWYAVGDYSINSGMSGLRWVDVPISVTAPSVEIELANDNASEIFNHGQTIAAIQSIVSLFR